MLYYFKKGKNATATYTYTKVCAVCREGAVIDWMCQKWFARFHTGGFCLDGIQHSGRPVKDRERDRDPTETLNENNQCYTTWERADILKISKSSMENHLRHLMFIALKFGFHVS